MTTNLLPARRALALLLAATAAFAAGTARADAAGSWAPATRLAEGSYTQPGGVAVAPDGTVTAAFSRRDDSPMANHVEVAVKPPGGTFGQPARLSSSGAAGLPWLVGDEQGNVAIVWTEQLAGTTTIRGTTKRAGGGFAPVQTISDTGSYADFPRVDMAGGIAVVAWSQGGRVRAATAHAGESFKVHDPLSGSIGFSNAPVVAVAPDGAAVVGWDKAISGTGGIHAAARTATGEFAPLRDVAQLPASESYPGFASTLRIAMSAEGRATLAWTYWDKDAHNYRLQAASRGRTGEFGGVENVAQFDSGYGGHFALDKAVDGTALLVWADHQLKYALRPEGGGFGATQAVAGSSPTSWVPQAKFGADGTARAVWEGAYAGRQSVETARIAPDGSSSYAEDIAVPATQAETSDSFGGLYGLDVDAHGDAAVSWAHFADVLPGPGTDYRRALEVRILDATPPALSGVQVPEHALTGSAVAMSATATDALSPVTIRWKLGKYLTAQGPAITHTYDAPGRFGVDVTATDAAGNTVQATRFVDVAPGPAGPACPVGQVCE